MDPTQHNSMQTFFWLKCRCKETREQRFKLTFETIELTVDAVTSPYLLALGLSGAAWNWILAVDSNVGGSLIYRSISLHPLEQHKWCLAQVEIKAQLHPSLSISIHPSKVAFTRHKHITLCHSLAWRASLYMHAWELTNTRTYIYTYIASLYFSLPANTMIYPDFLLKG